MVIARRRIFRRSITIRAQPMTAKVLAADQNPIIMAADELVRSDGKMLKLPSGASEIFNIHDGACGGVEITNGGGTGLGVANIGGAGPGDITDGECRYGGNNGEWGGGGGGWIDRGVTGGSHGGNNCGCRSEGASGRNKAWGNTGVEDGGRMGRDDGDGGMRGSGCDGYSKGGRLPAGEGVLDGGNSFDDSGGGRTAISSYWIEEICTATTGTSNLIDKIAIDQLRSCVFTACMFATEVIIM